MSSNSPSLSMTAPSHPPPPKASPSIPPFSPRSKPPSLPPTSSALNATDKPRTSEEQKLETEGKEGGEKHKGPPPPPASKPPSAPSTAKVIVAPPSTSPPKIIHESTSNDGKKGEEKREEKPVEDDEGNHEPFLSDNTNHNMDSEGVGGGSTEPIYVSPEEERIRKYGHSIEMNSEETVHHAMKQRVTDEVHRSSIQHYLIHSVQKTTTLKGVFPYLFLVALLTTSVLIGKIDGHAARRTDALAKTIFDANNGNAVTSYESATDYILSTMNNIFLYDNGNMSSQEIRYSDSIFVALVSVRMYRGNFQPCFSEQQTFLPVGERNVTESSSSTSHQNNGNFYNGSTVCLSEDEGEDTYSVLMSKYQSVDPFHNTSAFSSNNISGTHLFSGHHVVGFLRGSYSPVSYPVHLYNIWQREAPLVQHVDDQLNALSDLSAMLRRETSSVLAIVLECLLFDVNGGGLTHASYTYEQRSDATQSSLITYPFKVQGWRSGTDTSNQLAIFQLVVDGFLWILVVYVFYEIITMLRINLKLYRDANVDWLAAFSWWECFTIILCLFFVIMMFLKTYMWSLATQLLEENNGDASSSSSATLFRELMSFRDLHESLYIGLAWLLMLVYLRCFMYLRFSFRLSIINETIGSSVQEMVGILIIFILVFAAYAFSGVLLWGHDRPVEMGNMTKALNFLMLVMLNGGADTYAEFDAVDDLSAKIYFSTFFFLSWVVLLNVVVGVLALSFASVTETLMMMRRVEWTPRALLIDMGKFFRRATPGANKYSEFVDDRIRFLRALQLWSWQGEDFTISGEDYVSLKQCIRYFKYHSFTEEFIRVVFFKSVQQIGTSNARLRQLRLNHRALNNGVQMTQRFKSQASLVEDIHRKVCIQKALDATKTLHSMLVSSAGFQVVASDVKAVQRRVHEQAQIRHFESPKIDGFTRKIRRVCGMMDAVVSLLRNPGQHRRKEGSISSKKGAVEKFSSVAEAEEEGKPSASSIVSSWSRMVRSTIAPPSKLASSMVVEPTSTSSAASPHPFASTSSDLTTQQQRGRATTIYSKKPTGVPHSQEQMSSTVSGGMFPSSSSFSMGDGATDDPLERYRLFRSKIRNLSSQESDDRYDLKGECLTILHAIINYMKGYLKLCHGEEGGWNGIYSAFSEGKREMELRALEKRRVDDERRRAATAEEFELRKVQALMKLERQAEAEHRAHFEERLNEDDIVELQIEMQKEWNHDVNRNRSDDSASSPEPAYPLPRRPSSSPSRPPLSSSAMRNPINNEGKQTLNVSANPLDSITRGYSRSQSVDPNGVHHNNYSSGTSSRVTTSVHGEFNIHFKAHAHGFPTTKPVNEFTVLFTKPALPPMAQRGALSHVRRARSGSPPPKKQD